MIWGVYIFTYRALPILRHTHIPILHVIVHDVRPDSIPDLLTDETIIV